MIKKWIKILLLSISGFAALSAVFFLAEAARRNAWPVDGAIILGIGTALVLLFFVAYFIYAFLRDGVIRDKNIKEMSAARRLAYSQYMPAEEIFWNLREDCGPSVDHSPDMMDMLFMTSQKKIADTDIRDRAEGIAVSRGIKEFGGRSGYFNVLSYETDGNVKIHVFDRHYVIRYERYNSSIRRKPVIEKKSGAVILFDGKILPEFWMIPESFVERTMDRFLGADIDFEEAPVFSNAYRLTSTDINIKQFFSPQILSCFERHTGLTIESDRSMLYVTCEFISKAADFMAFADAVRDIAHNINSFAGFKKDQPNLSASSF